MSSQIEHIDLLALLKAYGNRGLVNTQVYGKITRQLDYPAVLQEGVVLEETGIFVEMSVFAVNLGYHEAYLRQNGFYNKDNVYMVNGNIVAYIDKTSINGADWYTIEGTLRYSSKSKTTDVVSVFNFYKTQDNKWGLHPIILSDLDISTWDRHSLCYSWINESHKQGVVKQPNYVYSLQKFKSEPDYKAEPKLIQKPEVSSQVQSTSSNVYTKSFKKEDRSDIKEFNENFEKFKSYVDEADTLKADYIKSLNSLYCENDDDKYLDYMLSGLIKYLKRKPSSKAMTGRVILKRYMDNFKGGNNHYIGNMSISKYLLEIFNEVAEFIKDHDRVVTIEGLGWDFCKTAFSNKELFYFGIVGIILGIPFDTIQSIVLVCKKNKLSAIRLLNENPYILQFVSTLGFDEIERIALCFNLHNDKSLDSYRNIVMLNYYINNSDNSNTAYTKNSIVNENIGIQLSSSKFAKMKSSGFYLPISTVCNIQAYLKLVSAEDLGYTPDGFKQVGLNYVRPLSAVEVINTLNDYKNKGLGIELNGYITSSSLCKKEIFILETFKKLGSITYDYDSNEIDKYIKEYEAIVGFTLEDKQRLAVHLVVHAGFVVAGSAGSGKTTVSNCIVYVLERLEPNIDIHFAAPTGKAAKRMQEVVGREVKTLHSKFKLGMSEEFLFSSESSDSGFGRIAFFFDEGAMITTDLLYRVFKHIDVETSRVFLFGDFNQLPPIGKGLPFKDALRFMPCVFLNVSKRAADGSQITKNSNFVNECSENNNWEPLTSGDDFFLLPTKSEQIQKVVYDLCAYYLGSKSSEDIKYITNYLNISELPKVPNITQDDIQVVTPISKATYKWGAIALNELLQPLFNPHRTQYNTFIYQISKDIKGSIFAIGDRVIHIDKNMYNMQWYGTYKNGNLQKIYGAGICNGEVGKIVGFYSSIDCSIYDETEKKPDNFEYLDNMRDDSTWYGEGKWFVLVEYYDYISKRNFYIAYRAELNSFVESNLGTVFKGEDLTKLTQFYAGTTHKLQGSQGKIIICPLDTVNYTGFITRQMLYTMFTRGEKLVFAVGSVGNEPTSMLSRARKDVASLDTITIGELIV